MCKFNPKNQGRRMDSCMKEFIDSLRRLGIKTLSCCCGHGKYKMSVVVDFGFSKLLPVEIFSGIELSRKKEFYKKDKQGYYYIPETLDYTNRCVCCYKKLPKNHPPMQSRCNKCDKEDL